MKERISEQISGTYTASLTANSKDIIDFEVVSEAHKYNITGEDYNFNYKITSLYAYYNLPSFALKPPLTYNITDTEAQRIANDIEFKRVYNNTTTSNEGKFYATKLSIIAIFNTGWQPTLGEVLLYNNGTFQNISLTEVIWVDIMSEKLKLKAEVTPSLGPLDSITIVGGYIGNVNYTFETGEQHHTITNLYP